MRKKIALLLLAAGILYAAAAGAATIHECDYCHVSDGKETAGKLRAPLSGLCLDCHPERKSPQEHRVDIVPPMKVVGLPLSADGKMTCVTCHDPHEKSGYPKLLRVRPSDLCFRCHFK
jgi:predicted CXXCH cytochrome family protein